MRRLDGIYAVRHFHVWPMVMALPPHCGIQFLGCLRCGKPAPASSDYLLRCVVELLP